MTRLQNNQLTAPKTQGGSINTREADNLKNQNSNLQGELNRLRKELMTKDQAIKSKDNEKEGYRIKYEEEKAKSNVRTSSNNMRP
jgi:hypothetical protein